MSKLSSLKFWRKSIAFGRTMKYANTTPAMNRNGTIAISGSTILRSSRENAGSTNAYA